MSFFQQAKIYISRTFLNINYIWKELIKECLHKIPLNSNNRQEHFTSFALHRKKQWTESISVYLQPIYPQSLNNPFSSSIQKTSRYNFQSTRGNSLNLNCIYTLKLLFYLKMCYTRNPCINSFLLAQVLISLIHE